LFVVVFLLHSIVYNPFGLIKNAEFLVFYTVILHTVDLLYLIKPYKYWCIFITRDVMENVKIMNKRKQ